MKYKDPNMEAYWNSLPAQVQAIINAAGIEVDSLGMLRRLGDYYQNGNDPGEGAVPEHGEQPPAP